MPDLEITDCSEALAAIECFRRIQKDLDKDITPRLIAWGLAAIAMENPLLKFDRRRWARMTTEERWRRVRMYLSATGINALADRLRKQYGREPPKQMSLLDEGTAENHPE